MSDEENQTDQTMAKRPAGFLEKSSLSGQRVVLLRIGDAAERATLSDTMRCYLGRFEYDKGQENAIDLAPYNAESLGVSHNHAQLHLENDRLFVTDFESTNGTFVGGQRIPPHTPAELQDGDELRLGNLAIRVMFR